MMNLISKEGNLVLKKFMVSMTLYPLETYQLPQCSFTFAMPDIYIYYCLSLAWPIRTKLW